MSEEPRLNAGRLVRYGLQAAILGLIVTGAILLFTIRPETWEHLKRFPVRYVPMLLALVVCAWVCAGTRIWILTKALGYGVSYRQAVIIGLSAEFGVAASPGGSGGAVVRLTFLRKAGVPFSVGASMLAVDVVLDVLFFALLSPFAVGIVCADPTWRSLLMQARHLHLVAVGAIVAGGLVLTATLVTQYQHIMRFMEGVAGGMERGRRWRLPARIRYARSATRRGLRRSTAVVGYLFRSRRPALFAAFMVTGVQWLCRYGVLPVLLIAFSTGRNPFPLILVQGFLFALSLLLVLPGGGGSVEIATMFVLRAFVASSVLGVVLLLWRFFTFYLYLLVGGVVFFWVCGRLNRVLSSGRSPEDLHPGGGVSE